MNNRNGDALEIQILKLREGARMPEKAHDDDAGWDLFAWESAVIPPGGSKLVQTGIALGLPPMTEAQVRPRSGLALNYQITILNAPGTIDAGYRGELGVILINHGKEDFVVQQGMKIAQLVIARVLPAQMTEVQNLEETPRGAGGFGSTGC